ncbi:beta strand repeat-containing protein [Sphingosinicella terrae]|uniref:beta strand repeat-containing protein n=1 Tax=Sphingosinicella terrae TaxID=2172047 RepID=UPI0013B3DBB2|nr:Ig-like domain-containing protein [Sphingosinicella terrae]
MPTYNGTNGNNVINGSNFDDIINGLGGNDVLRGRRGNDFINGGSGHDELDGDEGNDTLYGGTGNDEIHGGDGNDVAHGEADDDQLFGDDGNDTLTGGAGQDELDGGRDNDSLDGGEGHDILQGGDGNDSLTGGGGNDIIDGGNGFDTAYYSGSIFEYSFYGPLFGIMAIVHAGGAGADGSDLLVRVERLVFADAVIDLTGNNAPIAIDDAAATNEDIGTYSSGGASVLDNDFDFEGNALSVTPGSFNGAFGTLTLNADGTYSYTPYASTQALAAGQTVQDNFSYTVSDGSLTDTGTLTITIGGLNDAPVANADAASTGENAAILVDVLANDTDVDNGAVLIVVAASAPAGQGSASVVGNQVEFDPGSDFDDLAVGESEIVLVSYTIEDEHGASSSSTISITVTGTNDGPVANPDAASTGENAAILVDVLANDTDVDNGAVLTVAAASAPAGQGSASVVGNQVGFDPGSDFDDLAVGESEIVLVSYTIEDEHGASSSSTISITVTGANDAPTVDAGGTDASGSVTEFPNGDPNENAFVHQDSGTVAFDDPDLSDTHSASFAPQGGSYVGTFTLDPVDQIGDGVGWNFSVDDSAIDFLDEGEVLTQTYVIEIDDGNGGTVTQDVTITITGAGDNLPPDAVDDSYDATGNVTLTVTAAGGVLANDSDDAGVGTDPGETPVTAYDSVSANGGTVSMNPDGSFSYTSAPGFTGTDSFTYTITDADGETDTATVTINVESSVWFIDNGAVGSANLGTQADPYTSLAAFNAAQGAPDGPAEGETVYLREGLGTYAEADGINLLDGQVLVGGGQDLVIGGDLIESGTGRPTIVTTGPGGHGVELAQDNSLSGFDIGTTTGAGIADGGGSVGTLAVADVAKTGAGQIADIDQGGTVSVQLNTAQSTASAGGAIDLAGLSGSFAVTGGTLIAGAHGGGGVVVSGSTGLAVSLAGNVVLATGAADAVRFDGNSSGGLSLGGTVDIDVAGGGADGIQFTNNAGSSLTVGGDLDIDATDGIALSVQNGGSVAIGGGSATLSATTGSAVVIRDSTSAGVTLESASASGGNAAGIILDNAGSGGFTVTGIGSVAGSGGTITGKSGADGSLVDGIGIVITDTANVSLSNMAISNTSNFGILAVGVADITIRDSAVTGSHGTSLGLGESAVSVANATGNLLLEGNVIAGGRADNLHIVHNSGSLDVVIRDSADDQAIFGHNHLDGNDSLFVQTGGSASLALEVDGVEFQGARSDQVFVNATGSSSQDLVFTGNQFHNSHANTNNAGGGVILIGGGVGSNIEVDYLFQENSFLGAHGNALAAVYSQQSGAVQGRIEDNAIGLDDGIDGSEGSSGGGNGIFLDLEKTAGPGNASYVVDIVDNRIHDIAQGIAGLFMQVSGGGAANPAIFEARVHGNVIGGLGDFAFTGIYAGVGVSAPSGDFSQFGLDLHDNVVDASGADFGLDAIYFDQSSSDAHFYFPGYAGSPDGEYQGGTASADLGTFFASQGNVLINGGFPSWPTGVDAGIITDATGDPLVLAPWFP